MTGPAREFDKVVPKPYGSMLRTHAANLTRAYRGPIYPGCTIGPQGTTTVPPATPAVQRRQLLRIPIVAVGLGDNVLISTLVGRKLIYEIFLWNTTTQDLALYQGPSANGILLMTLTGFPANTGLTLGFNGNFAMPHFDIDPGQTFVLNTPAGEVDGFLVYRNETSSSSF